MGEKLSWWEKIADALCRGSTHGDLKAYQAAWNSGKNSGGNQRSQPVSYLFSVSSSKLLDVGDLSGLNCKTLGINWLSTLTL